MNEDPRPKELNDMLENLAVMRQTLAEAKEKKNAILEAVKLTEDYMAVDAQVNIIGKSLLSTEDYIRTLALELYDEGVENANVKVKWFQVCRVPNELAAKEWCITHFTPALKLDLTAFEKAAKAGNIPAELATVEKEARAQIASNIQVGGK